MRISDWSSDVCSSDLAGAAGGDPAPAVGPGAHAQRLRQPRSGRPADRPRDRAPAADGLGLLQQGDRQLAGRGSGPDQEPRVEHTVQARHIGRASRRERVCQSVSLAVSAVALTKNNPTYTLQYM